MTKKQAIEQAVKLLGNDAEMESIVEKGMEIFAGAFAEWVESDGWMLRVVSNITTLELIAEFEKIEHK